MVVSSEMTLSTLGIPTPSISATALGRRSWKSNCFQSERMAKPDMPNFTIGGRIVFGVIALVVIIAMLRLFGVF